MRRVLLSLAALAACLLVPYGRLAAQTMTPCYHCQWGTDGTAFCNPITAGGYKSCNGRSPTPFQPAYCSLSGDSCNNTVMNVSADGRVLASTNGVRVRGTGQPRIRRRPCDGAIVERRYAAARASRARANSRVLRV